MPPERRSATLNLVYLPLYLGGIVGPLLASFVVTFGIGAPFVVGAIVFLVGGVLVALQARRPTSSGSDGEAAFERDETMGVPLA